jgi:hypothetical protein
MPGPTNLDRLNREILNSQLGREEWTTSGARLNAKARDEMVLMWHKLDGAHHHS